VRILLLDQFSEMGGGQQALLDTVEAVQQNGWEPHVLVPGRGPLVAVLESRSVPVGEIQCAPYSSGTKSVIDSVRFALDLHRQVNTIRDKMVQSDIGLIYVNGPRLLRAAALAARGRAKLLFHLHNHLRGAALWLTRRTLGWTPMSVVGCSNSLLEPLRHSVDARHLHVIPNGVRDTGYRERRFDARGRLHIGMIGRIAREKGQMEFVHAAALLNSELPQAHFTICGAPLFRTSRHYFDAVRTRSRDLPVEFVGWQQDVSRVLHTLDLLVVPSSEEGMGRIVLEAFSAGVPVIAFPAGGIPEAVIDGVTGLLTRGFTAEALAARIRDAINADPERVQQIVRNARQAWMQYYSLSIYQARITALLESLFAASQEDRAVEMPLQRR
jgi:glycosyltransferase involved in cell wall biosynthesis